MLEGMEMNNDDFTDFTNAGVAQLVEREAEDLRVGGSIPSPSTKF